MRGSAEVIANYGDIEEVPGAGPRPLQPIASQRLDNPEHLGSLENLFEDGIALIDLHSEGVCRVPNVLRFSRGGIIAPGAAGCKRLLDGVAQATVPA